MAKQAAPVLFGRRMKRVPENDRCWYLDLGPFSFVVIQRDSRCEAELLVNGFVEEAVDRSSLATAINWLTAQRDRLVKSLTPEGR